MSDYTPTTETVRDCVIFDFDMSEEETVARFDRWLAEVKAQAVRDFVESAVKPEKIMESVAAGFNESVREVMAQAWEQGWRSRNSKRLSFSENPYLHNASDVGLDMPTDTETIEHVGDIVNGYK